MPPDVHEPKEPDLVDLTFAACRRLRGRSARINPNATENQYSHVIPYFRHATKHRSSRTPIAKPVPQPTHGPSGGQNQSCRRAGLRYVKPAMTNPVQHARSMPYQSAAPGDRGNGDQIRPSDRNARDLAARDHGRHTGARSHRSPAPQPQGGMGAPTGAGERAHDRRPDLAAVPRRRQQRAHAGRLDARRGAAQRRSGRARRRARDEAEHSLHRAVPLYRPLVARRARLRGLQSGQSGLPGRSRHQEGLSRSRRALRRRARSFHQPRP